MPPSTREPEPGFQLSTSWRGPTLVLGLAGAVDADERDQIIQAMDGASSAADIWLDVSCLTLAGSAVLSALIHAARRFEPERGRVVLVNPSDRLLALLEVCGLDHLFTVRLG